MMEVNSGDGGMQCRDGERMEGTMMMVGGW